MKKTIPVLMSIIILLTVSCSITSQQTSGEEISVEGGSYTNITPTELNTVLEEEDVTLVNVHIPFEGDLPGTDLSIPYNDIESYLDQLPEDKNTRIVLYCRSGSMSDIAARSLVQLGYRNLWNLQGGFVAWQEAGYPMAESP
jgi:rhodanese-related sulfurtransferase